MASIDFRGWRIESDAECWVLGKPKTRLNKHRQQEQYLENPTYHPRLEDALNAAIQKELRASDAASAADIIQLLRTLRQEVEGLLGVAV